MLTESITTMFSWKTDTFNFMNMIKFPVAEIARLVYSSINFNILM